MAHLHTPTDPEAAAAVSVAGLTKSFGKVVAVDGVSFDIARGEVFGLLGPNGAGKTTTISILCTLLRPGAGRATVEGCDLRAEPAAVRRHVGLVFQETTLDLDLTARENLRFHTRLYKIDRHAERIDDSLELVGLADRQNDLVKTFSGGMKRRLEIARSMLHQPSVLFLDEPTLGLDPEARERIWEHLQRLKSSGRVTIVLTTHYMEEADLLCDRIAIMNDGRMVALDTPAELKRAVGGDIITIKMGDGGLDDADLESLADNGQIRVERASARELRLTVRDSERHLFDVIRYFQHHDVEGIAIERASLNDVFLHFAGRTLQAAAE